MQDEFGDVVETQPVKKKTFDDTAATADVYGQDHDSDVQWCQGRVGTPAHLEPRGNSGLVANLAPRRDDEGKFRIGLAWFTANFGENKRREEGELLTFYSPRAAQRNPSSRNAESWNQYVVDDGPWWGPLVPAVLNKGGFFEVVTRFKRGIYETIVPYDFLCSQYGPETHSMEALHGILWQIISRVGAGVIVEPSTAEHECSTEGWARDAKVSKGEGCTVDALDDDKYAMEFKLRTGGKHDAGDERSMHGGRRKAALPKFCAMTCGATAPSGTSGIRIAPLAPQNYRRTCEAVQNLVTALADAANYADAFFQFLANGTEDAKILKRLRFYLIATRDLKHDKRDNGRRRSMVDLSESRADIEKAVKRAYKESLRRHNLWVERKPTERKLQDDFFDLYISPEKKTTLETRRRAAAAAAAAAAGPKKKKRRSAPPPPPQLRKLMWAGAVELLRERIESGAGPEVDSSGDADEDGDAAMDAEATAPPPPSDDDSDDDATPPLTSGQVKGHIGALKAHIRALQRRNSASAASDDDDDQGLQLREAAAAADNLERLLTTVGDDGSSDSSDDDDDDDDDSSDSSDDDDAPAPAPAPAAREDSSSDDDSSDDDDDVHMAPAPAPAPPRAPRKRARAPPGRADAAEAPKMSPKKQLLRKKQAQMRSRRGGG
jgi:hypothetical protein